MRGVVTGDFESATSATGLEGFFLQSLSADQDDSDATSEGIFAYRPAASAVDVKPTPPHPTSPHCLHAPP